MMLIPIILLSLLVMVYLQFWWSRRRMRFLASLVPGTRFDGPCPALPLVGNGHMFIFNTQQNLLKKIVMLSEEASQNGGVVKMWMGPLLYFVITNPADAEIVLNNCLHKGTVYRFGDDWVGNGLVTGRYHIWKRHRKLLAPAFNKRVVDSFLNQFNELSVTLVQQLTPEVGKGNFDIYKYISRAAFDLVCESAMGTKVNALLSEPFPYLDKVYRVATIAYDRIFKVWLHPDCIFKLTQDYRTQMKNVEYLHQFSASMIQRKKTECREKTHNTGNIMDSENDKATSDEQYEQSSNRLPLLELMLQLGLSEQETRDEVDTLLEAGHATYAITNSYALLMLAKHPHIQRRAYKEQLNIFGDSKRHVTIEDLPKMRYLESVLNETMRLFPITPILLRDVDQDIRLTNYTIPSGSGCAISAWGLQRDPRVWGADADCFNPERWSSDLHEQRHVCSFIPFSFGPRNCPGRYQAMMELKILISTVLRYYRLTSDSKYPELKADLFLKPVNGYVMAFEYR